MYYGKYMEADAGKFLIKNGAWSLKVYQDTNPRDDLLKSDQYFVG